MAAGSQAAARYGVRGIPYTVLIDPQGNLAWSGSPSGLSKAVVKQALKGARRPKNEFLAVRFAEPVEGKAAELARDGELVAARKEAGALLADAQASEAAKQGATAVQEAIAKQIQLLRDQADQLVKSRDPERALRVLEGLAKEFGSSEAGAAAKKRAGEIEGDPKLSAELEAGKGLERLKEQIRPLKKDKAVPKIEEFIRRHAGTKAADRAKYLLPGAKRS